MEMGADRSWSFENIINKLGYSSRKIAAVEWHLRTADFVVANSELQMRFLVNELPEIAGRVSYVHLGIEPFEQDSCIRQSRCSVVEHEEFYSVLGDTHVCVMKSRHEAFVLSAIDALRAGASLLLSGNCGVGEILS